MSNIVRNLLIDLMGLHINDSDYEHEGRELMEHP